MDTNNKVMVGDTWESCDSRRPGVRFEIVEVTGFEVTVKRPNGQKGTIKLGRMTENRKGGYRLVSRAGAVAA